MSEANLSWADSRVRDMIGLVDMRRKARGLTLQQLVDDSGVSFDTLHGWRVGSRSPWMGSLDAVLRALGLRMMIEPEADTETQHPVTLTLSPGDDRFWRDFKYQLLLPRIDEIGMAAYKIAQVAGLSPATIYNWERGDKAKITTLLKVLHVLGYTVTVVDAKTV